MNHGSSEALHFLHLSTHLLPHMALQKDAGQGKLWEPLATELDLEACLPTCITQTHTEDHSTCTLLLPFPCTPSVGFQPLDLFILAGQREDLPEELSALAWAATPLINYHINLWQSLTSTPFPSFLIALVPHLLSELFLFKSITEAF